jgi:hypothetical protein
MGQLPAPDYLLLWFSGPLQIIRTVVVQRVSRSSTITIRLGLLEARRIFPNRGYLIRAVAIIVSANRFLRLDPGAGRSAAPISVVAISALFAAF